MATTACGCGKRHRSPDVAARCTAAQDTTTAAATTAPVVRPDDLAGCLSLLDGRLVATTTGVLPVSGYGRVTQTTPLPGQVADADALITLLLEAGATARPSWTFTPREYEAAAALLTAQLAAEAAA